MVMRNFTLIVVGILASSAFASADDIVTDRPDATESSSVVEPGYYQIEAGWLYADNDGTGVDVHTLPQTLFRMGIVDRLELRLGWDGYIDEGSGGASGVGDGELGAKHTCSKPKVTSPKRLCWPRFQFPWEIVSLLRMKSIPDFDLRWPMTSQARPLLERTWALSGKRMQATARSRVSFTRLRSVTT